MSVEQKARVETVGSRSSSSPGSHQDPASIQSTTAADIQAGVSGLLQATPADYMMSSEFLQSCVQNPFLSMMYGMNPYMNPNVAQPAVDVMSENPLQYWSLLAAAAQLNNVGGTATTNPVTATTADPLSAAAMVNLMGMGANAGGQVGGGHPGILPSTNPATNAAAAALLPNLVSSFQTNGGGSTMIQQSTTHNKPNGGQQTPNNNLVERNGRMRMGRVHGPTSNSQIPFDGGFSTRYTLNLPADRNQNDVQVKNDEHGEYLDVQCGNNNAKLYVDKLCQGSKGKAILFKGHWYSPNEFQTESGRETAKDWKRSIRHQQKSLKVMMTKRLLIPHTNDCQCGQCATPNPLPLPYSNEMEQAKKRRTNSGSSTNIPTSSAVILKNWSMASNTSSAVSPSQLSDKSDIENFATSLPSTVDTSTPVRGSDFSKKNGKGGGSSYDVTANNNDVAMSDYSEGGNCIARKRQRLDDYAYEQIAMQEVTAAASSAKHRHQAANNQNAASSPPPPQHQHLAMLQYPQEFMNAFAPHQVTGGVDPSFLTSALAASYPQSEQHMDHMTQDQFKKFQTFLINSAKFHMQSNNSPTHHHDDNNNDDNSPAGTNGANSPAATNGANSPATVEASSPAYQAGSRSDDEEEERNVTSSVEPKTDNHTTATTSDAVVKTEPAIHGCEPVTAEKSSTSSPRSPPSGGLPTADEKDDFKQMQRGRSNSDPGQKKPRNRKSKAPRRILTKRGREEMIRSAPDLSVVLYAGSPTTSHHGDHDTPATPTSSVRSFPAMNGGTMMNRDSLIHHTMPLPCVHYDSAVLERVTAKSAEMAKWDCERVCQFLDELGCSQYRQNFMDNGVTGHSLPFLRLECLEELGVSKMHSHVIMGSIHRFLGSFGIVFNGRHNYPPSSSSSCATSPPRE